jgi:8-oxo-dGTP pyrophosphatase MutT (NUDIX family)
MHLVAYAVLVDPDTRHVLLVDHRSAERWLPTGGHIDPGEVPFAAAGRELREELGIAAVPYPGTTGRPVLVTVTRTVGNTQPHDDVSLWFAFAASTETLLVTDTSEFADWRWWPIDEVRADAVPRVDPHLPRFLRKLDEVTA